MRAVPLSPMVFALALLSTVHAISQTIEPPKLVVSYAERLLESCTTSNQSDSTENEPAKLIQLLGTLENEKIFLVDGFRTPCEDSFPLCGTGGCPVGIFLVSQGIIRTVYDDQVLGWSLSPDETSVKLDVHGSRCEGRSGPDSCVTEVDLTTARTKTYAPDMEQLHRRYLAQLRAILEKKKVNPRTSHSASAFVRLKIAADGTLYSRRITKSSGHQELDAAALASIDNASPFPPFEHLGKDEIEVTVPYKFSTNGASGRGSDDESGKPGYQFLSPPASEKKLALDGSVSSLFATVQKMPSQQAVLEGLAYDGKQDVSLRYGDLFVEISSEASEDDPDFRVPVVVGKFQDEHAFKIEIKESGRAEPSADVRIARLDPKTNLPQVVLSYFWGGAHCCTVTKIATADAKGRWRIVEGDTLDGDVGYDLKDVDGDGEIELISADNSFLYAFDGYAGSYAPTRISKLRNARLIDVTREPQYRRFLSTSLEKNDAPELKGANGYLGGWVAQKALVGEIDEAWQTMLASYDRSSDWPLEECQSGANLNDCPKNEIRKLSFPEALKKHLVREGYITVAQARRLKTTSFADKMSQCVSAMGTVKDLIVSTYVGQGGMERLLGEFVTLENDVTVEGYEPSLNKVTCAVTYEVALSKMIGRLAENGQMQIANRLSKLARQKGAIITHRLPYTVKPTSGKHEFWVQLL